MYESTQFALVMVDLGIQQIFAMSPQAKGRVERMASTFQDRLVTELRLAGATTMEQANEFLQEFLPRFNARFSVTAEQLETAYRPVPADLSLTETVSIQHTRKVVRDNTVHYHWRVLQLLPGAERPSYAGLRVEVLERTDGELLIIYQGGIVDFQEGEPPASALWGEGTCRSPDLEDIEGAVGQPSSYLDRDQRKLLPPWTPRWRSGRSPGRPPARVGLEKENRCATNCTAPLPPPSRPAGWPCNRPKVGVSP